MEFPQPLKDILSYRRQQMTNLFFMMRTKRLGIFPYKIYPRMSFHDEVLEAVRMTPTR
jgi:hypothetical protein